MTPHKASGQRAHTGSRGRAGRCLAWLLACGCSAALAQAAAPPAPDPAEAGTAVASAAAAAAVSAVRLQPGERLALDGTLAHPAWQRAPVHADFIEFAPVNGRAPAHATRVRVLFDAQALYVGIEALDGEPQRIRAPLVKADGVNRTQDFVVVYVDAIGSRQSAQFFRVNAAGSLSDGMHTAADDSEDFSPDFDFDAATARNAAGWTAVLRIPFASLRYASVDQGQAARPWRFMVARRVPREQFHLDLSVPLPRGAPSFIAALQPLQGVQGPEQAQFLSLRPSLTWRSQRLRPADGTAQRDQSIDATLDVKWRPLPELVVDATLNPDFSQLALDVPQLAGNTRFALEYPETRPFFFESSDLLRSPTPALYTRSFTEPRGGLRATWRGSRLAGSAFVVDDRGGGSVLLPGPYGSGSVAQPASRAAVLRLRADAGPLQWGAVAAQRRYAGGRGDNQLLGPDLTWQMDADWRLRAQWLQSRTSAQPLGDDLARGDGVAGHHGHLKLWYQTPRLEFEASLDDLGTGFRNDLGFQVQNGVRDLKARLGHGWQGLGPFNDFWVNLEAARVVDRRSGQAVSSDWSPGLWMTAAHNLEATLSWHGWAAQRVAADQPLQRERYLKANLVLTPAAWAPLLEADLQWGRLLDVAAQRVRPGGRASLALNTRLLPRLELEPRLSMAWLRQDGQPAYTEAAHQLLARWHFSARHTLRAIWQYTAQDRRAEADLAGQRQVGNTGSITWTLRQSAGSVLYIGASRSREPAGEGMAAGLRRSEAFVKLQVDVDELRQRF